MKNTGLGRILITYRQSSHTAVVTAGDSRSLVQRVFESKEVVVGESTIADRRWPPDVRQLATRRSRAVPQEWVDGRLKASRSAGSGRIHLYGLFHPQTHLRYSKGVRLESDRRDYGSPSIRATTSSRRRPQ